jgi:CubicO group peptidase (beta-lactamase class C family)
VILAASASTSAPTPDRKAGAAQAQGGSEGGISWTPTKSGELGVDRGELDSIYRDMDRDEHHDMKGIVVVRDGRLVSEHYFNGDSVDSLHDIRSATKSITSLLMGIAVDKGPIRSINDSISLYLPGLPKDGKEKITIEDLLTMRSGLAADDGDPASPGNEDRLDESTDWIRTAYSVPMKIEPGMKYLYCSLNAFLTGAIVENATHMRLDQFAEANLFAPLGIEHFTWRHVPVDRTTGQGNLSITTRDEAAIGELMLDDGVVNSRRVVSHEWVAQSLANLVAISDSDAYADFYGLMWYTKAEPVGGRTIEVHFASGNGGNKVYIIPSLHMVVAITASAYNQPYRHKRSTDVLLRILAATHAN